MTESKPCRRADDPRVTQLVNDVTTLKYQMEENTAVTIEVRDLLAGIKLFGKISKWGFAIFASLAAAWASIKGFSR